MTATPERSDEKSILPYFDNRIAVEIRLPEAINREFLVPFHYFGVLDSADLKSVRFEKGKFNTEDLEKEYNNKVRAQHIVDKVNYYWPYIDKIRCIGFCVSIAHAEFMADFFNKCGYNARAVHGNAPKDLREQTPSDFGSGKINFIFTVDLYNEGVDIPEINTILFLRPTESLTIFIQQLGRGLRTCEGKSELLVLDFIGQFKANYRMYEKKIKYLTSDSKKGVKHQISNGFSGLPAGCNIKLEEKVPKIILDAIPKSRVMKELLESIRTFLEVNNRLPTFKEFIDNTEESLQSFYEKYTFSELCFTVLNKSFDDKMDRMFRNGLKKLCHIDSAHWIDEMQRILNEDNPTSTDRTPLFKSMFYYSFLNDPPSASQYKTFDGFIKFVKGQDSYKNEILSVLNIRKDKLKFIGDVPTVNYSCGLDIHCKYFRNQIFAGLGINTESYKNPSREGVYYSKDLNTDVLLITLNKSEKDFSPTTRYADYPISENRFHWQTQSKTTDQSKDELRYINQKENGSTVLLFVREDATKGSFAMPFMFLGKGTIEHYENNKPMDIIWTMETNIPAQILAYSPVRS